MKKNVGMLMLALPVVGVVAIAAFSAVWIAADWTDDGVDVYPGGTVLRNAAGDVMRVSLGEGDVDCRPYYVANPDDWIVKALVAAEDGTFWEHCGVRPMSAIRAAFQNVVCRRRVSGASTITMQAVRLIRPHPKTLWWKCKEAVMAVKMERAKDKRWILSQYLNRAPYGSNFIGIEAAANGWFGKGAKDLGLGEAAMLAGMVQAPSRFRPDRGMERALKRRDYVLERMVKLGLATVEQADAARSVKPTVCRAPRPFRHPHYCDWAMRQAGLDCDAQRRGGDIVTALDEDMQTMCEGAVSEAARTGGYSAAAVVMRVDTGAVVALACSGSYFDGLDGQVNTAIAPRPAGSTLKPFLVAHALDRGLTTPEERMADTPIACKGYRPSNFDAQYRGLVSVRDALVLSLNIPFVRLLSRTGIGEFGESLASLGFSGAGGCGEEPGLGLAIGNAEVSLVELVAAYATVARGGVYRRPSAFAAPGAVAHGVRVFSEGACYLVSDMLSGDERSSAALGHVADVEAPRFAWKTGTSAAYRDAWTVAWNPQYAVGVWCGHKSGGFGDKSLVGAKAAAPVAWRIARSIYPGNDGPWFAEPGEILHRRVCSLTGLPATGDCPKTEDGRAVAGRSGATPCHAHVRDLDGRVVERRDASATGIAISKPENDAVFHLVSGKSSQKVVCRVIGNPAGSRLWWYDNGTQKGMSAGDDSFALELDKGVHSISCSTADGASSSVQVRVADVNLETLPSGG